jgi:DMSO reductase family type II enzyme chaperone
MELENRSIERAEARAAIYYYLSTLFVYPDTAAWRALEEFSPAVLEKALAILGWSEGECRRAQAVIRTTGREQFEAEYLASFGHTAAGETQPYEAGYGAKHVFQETQCLADVAGFYSAFGLTPSELERERPDHIAVELEFMHVLALKEVYASAEGWDDKAALCRDAERDFLRDHLGRWAPAFLKRLGARDRGSAFAAIGAATAAFVEAHCRELGVEPGAGDVEVRAPSEAEGANFSCSQSCVASGSGAAAEIISQEEGR